MMNSRLLSILSAAIFLVLPLNAVATIIFDNLTGTDTLGGYVVGLYPGTSNTYEIGFNFVVPAGNDYVFTGGAFSSSLDIDINSINAINITLHSGGLPGVELETISLVDVLTSSIEIVPFSSVSNPLLMGGGQYWLTAAMTDPSNSRAYWWTPDQYDPGLIAVTFNGGSWSPEPSPRGAFQITGNPVAVTEPGTLALVCMGLVGLGLARRKKLKQ